MSLVMMKLSFQTGSSCVWKSQEIRRDAWRRWRWCLRRRRWLRRWGGGNLHSKAGQGPMLSLPSPLALPCIKWVCPKWFNRLNVRVTQNCVLQNCVGYNGSCRSVFCRLNWRLLRHTVQDTVLASTKTCTYWYFRLAGLLKACSKPGSFYDDGGGGEPTIFMAVILQICCVSTFIRIEQRTQESTESWSWWHKTIHCWHSGTRAVFVLWFSGPAPPSFHRAPTIPARGGRHPQTQGQRDVWRWAPVASLRDAII